MSPTVAGARIVDIGAELDSIAERVRRLEYLVFDGPEQAQAARDAADLVKLAARMISTAFEVEA